MSGAAGAADSEDRSTKLRAAEREVHTAYTALRVALEQLHHVLNPPGYMQGDVGTDKEKQ